MTRRRVFLLGGVILILLLAGSLFNPFSDEPDNFLGGKLIARGEALYVDYWSHHAPLPYQVSAAFYAAGARTYLQFRLLYALIIWLSGMALYRYLRQDVLLWMLLALAATAPVTRANAVIAEGMAGYLMLAAWLLIQSDQPGALPVIVLLLWLLPLATLKLAYLAVFLFIMTVWTYRQHPARLMAALIPPAVLSALYLAVYRNGAELVDQAYRYNATVYAAYSGFPSSPVAVFLSGITGFIHAQGSIRTELLSVTGFFGMALVAAWLWQGKKFDALLLTGLLVLSFPSDEQVYHNDALHFAGHYMALVATAVYAVGWFEQTAGSNAAVINAAAGTGVEGNAG